MADDNTPGPAGADPQGAGHPVLGAAFLAVVFALACGVAWDYLGSNAIQRARSQPGCSQTAQAAELDIHQLPNLPTLTDPTGTGTHANVHIHFTASFLCVGDGGRRIEADQFDDARGTVRADGSIQEDRDIDPEDGLAPFNWAKGG